jgi:hypothetical protein
MTELKKTLAVIKARWPEVTFIIGLSLLPLVVNESRLLIALPKESPLQTVVGIAFPILRITIIVIAGLATTGFQRTFYIERQTRQSPITLLRVGKHFFWRVIGFGLLCFPAFLILGVLSFLLIKSFAAIQTGSWETFQITPRNYGLCFTISSLILIKPLLLTVPLIVVLDCRIYTSLKLLRKCKLMEARELIFLFLVSMGVSVLQAFMPDTKSSITPLELLLIVGWSALQRFIGLMIAIMAVRFVASLDLGYGHEPRIL